MFFFYSDPLSNKYDANLFVNELVEASRYLGILDAKISNYKFNSVLMPMLHSKEALASMDLEGTQTTITNVLEDEIKSKQSDEREFVEYRNHVTTLSRGEDFLRSDDFSNDFIQKMHLWLLTDVCDPQKIAIGKYKTKNNIIVNSSKKIVFEPPAYTETKKYMDGLITFMNKHDDQLNPLVKAAIIHADFESIHPFEDGNGRVGRTLVSLYLYKTGIISHPYFYFSEAINQDKLVYYKKLDSSRGESYTEWITFFLKKIIAQAKKHIEYIDSLNTLYEKTKVQVAEAVNSPKFDGIMTCLFRHPIVNANFLADRLGISNLQANRYVDSLEKKNILYGNDRKRNRLYYFMELLDLMRR